MISNVGQNGRKSWSAFQWVFFIVLFLDWPKEQHFSVIGRSLWREFFFILSPLQSSPKENMIMFGI